MGKKSKKTASGKLQTDCSAVLSELATIREIAETQSIELEKTARQLKALKKQIANIKSCNCRKAKKPKKKKSVETTQADNMLPFVGMGAPEGGAADDLKMIAGIGPKLEETLNALGIYHFHQIAAWTKAETDWVDDHLMFTGRIERENWIEQAQALAKGGRDEYVKVFGIEPR